MSILDWAGLTSASRDRAEFAFFLRRPSAFVMSMRAAQEWDFVQDVLLKPFKPEIDHWGDEQRYELGEDQSSDNDQSKRPARCRILTKSEREWNCAHQRGERRHHNRTKSFYAGFVNRRAQVPAFIDSLQREINHHDPVFLHDAEQQKQSDHAVERQSRSENPECE